MSDWKLRKSTNAITALERLYTKADQKTICREGDPEAAFLLAPAGGEIPPKLARRLGLFDGPKSKIEVKTMAPEEIESRSTRPVETKDLKKK